MIVVRPVSAVLIAYLATACVLRPAAPQAVPADWTRYQGELTYASPEVMCSMYLDTYWRVTEVTGTVGVEERVSSSLQEEARAALPYPIAPRADMLDEQPDPPSPPPGQPQRTRADVEAWARRYVEKVARRAVFAVSDGWLVGFNAGEYGGSLWWFPRQPGPGRKLRQGNVVSIHKGRTDDEVVVLTGLAHLNSDYGRVVLAKRDAGGWRAEDGPDLGAEPLVTSTRRDQSLLIVTGSRVLAYTPPADLKPLANGLYPYLRANSVLETQDGQIYLGMPFFVIRLTPTDRGYVHEWYVPSRCSAFRRQDFLSCECTGPLSQPGRANR